MTYTYVISAPSTPYEWMIGILCLKSFLSSLKSRNWENRLNISKSTSNAWNMAYIIIQLLGHMSKWWYKCKRRPPPHATHLLFSFYNRTFWGHEYISTCIWMNWFYSINRSIVIWMETNNWSTHSVFSTQNEITANHLQCASDPLANFLFSVSTGSF